MPLVIVPTYAPHMIRTKVGDGAEGRSRLARWLLGIATTALATWGGFLFVTQVVGTHITDCGFDANGAYAEVRANLGAAGGVGRLLPGWQAIHVRGGL